MYELAGRLLCLTGAATALFLFAAGDALAIWEGSVRAFGHSVLIAFLAFSAISALATGVLQPRRPNWRLVGIPTAASRRMLWATLLLATAYSIDLLLHDAIRLFHMPVAIGVLQTSIAISCLPVCC